MTAPQWLSAIVGSGLALASLAGFVRNKTRRFRALFWLAIGGTMVYAAFRPQIIEMIGSDSALLRLRLVVALLSFIVLTITLEAIRVARMQERYAFLWLATGVVLLTGALFGDLAVAVTRLTGMGFADTVLVVLFAFVVLMLFSLSVALSLLQHKLAQVAREAARIEERLRRLEQPPPGPCENRPPQAD